MSPITAALWPLACGATALVAAACGVTETGPSNKTVPAVVAVEVAAPATAPTAVKPTVAPGSNEHEPTADNTPVVISEGEGFVFEGLETRSQRRAFYTAPPVIPHRVGEGDQECLNCHQEQREFHGHVAPATPHPELVNCQQCH
ncbi:MAG: hypothetical protein ACYTF0_09575, partial [Planctomycetota bacterium]